MDVAPTLGVVKLEDLVVDAERRWPGTERRLRDVLERRPKAPASGLVREVVARFDPAEAARLMSWLEVTYLRVFKEAGLPPPTVNCRLRDANGNLIAKVDFIWPHASLVVEVDGLRWHSSPSQKQHDDARQNRIVLSGRRVLRYSKADLTDEARVVTEIRSALAMATPELPLF